VTTYIALLRAVNVGGTGKLPMADLKRLCGDLGFTRIETYIASGNVVFDCDLAAGKVQAALERQLLAHTGKAIGTFVRTATELQAVLKGNPFPAEEPKHTYVFFLEGRPASDAVLTVRGRHEEEIRLGRHEIYVHYPGGMGQSQLKIPAAKFATARNLNTVATLVGMSTRAAGNAS
jgi:uncharacterized protein (DUF1697 family)